MLLYNTYLTKVEVSLDQTFFTVSNVQDIKLLMEYRNTTHAKLHASDWSYLYPTGGERHLLLTIRGLITGITEPNEISMSQLILEHYFDKEADPHPANTLPYRVTLPSGIVIEAEYSLTQYYTFVTLGEFETYQVELLSCGNPRAYPLSESTGSTPCSR